MIVLGLVNGTPPKEVRIFKFGITNTEKGDFLFDQKAAKLVMASYKKWSNRFSWDYNHLAVKGTGPAGSEIASAWCDLEVRDDGLYCVNIEWTPKAEGYLKNKEYRYFSPAFTVDEDNRIVELTNCSLTNLPATRNMIPLVAEKLSKNATRSKSIMTIKLEDEMPKDGEEKQVLSEEEKGKLEEEYKSLMLRCHELEEQLGLKKMEEPGDDSASDGSHKEPDSDDPKMAEEEEESEGEDEPAEATTSKALTINTILGLDAKACSDEVIGKLLAIKAQADRANTLSQEVKVQQKSAHEVAVDKAIATGRIVKAQRKFFVELSPKTLKAYLDATPARPTHNKVTQPAVTKNSDVNLSNFTDQTVIVNGQPVHLSKDEVAMASQLGLDVEKAAQRKLVIGK